MNVIRAFIAIELPEEVQIPLRKLSSKLQAGLVGKSIRWLPIENMHLTLTFLKNLALSDIDELADSMRHASAEIAPFDLSLGGLGLFPSPQRPRVIWMGVESQPDLLRLQERMESETTRMGYPTERRAFSPHLTLGRVRRNAPPAERAEISQMIEAEKLGDVGKIRGEEVVLFRSELRPSGALYTELSASRLGNPSKEPAHN